MRKTGGTIAIALEPNRPESIAIDLSHRARGPILRMTPAENELHLIERAKKDPRAFAPLYDSYADMIWRFAMSRLGDPERARDVTSQTFVKAIQSLPKFQPKLVASGLAPDDQGTSFPAWLMTIARNTIIDEQRRHRPSADIQDIAIQSQLSGSASPETITIRREQQQRVRQAIAQLSPRQQRMVELRIAGYSGREIAEIMGMTLAGVRTAHSRAYARLRDILADDI